VVTVQMQIRDLLCQLMCDLFCHLVFNLCRDLMLAEQTLCRTAPTLHAVAVVLRTPLGAGPRSPLLQVLELHSHHLLHLQRLPAAHAPRSTSRSGGASPPSCHARHHHRLYVGGRAPMHEVCEGEYA
jgi:hypothetical protein